jgi:hypothetical protein
LLEICHFIVQAVIFRIFTRRTVLSLEADYLKIPFFAVCGVPAVRFTPVGR